MHSEFCVDTTTRKALALGFPVTLVSDAHTSAVVNTAMTEQIAKLTFTEVYPHYLTKVEKKERTKEELHQVIKWLTGYDEITCLRVISTEQVVILINKIGTAVQLSKSKLGLFGILFGSIALMMALVSFWAGPFSPQPTLETTVVEKATSLRQKAIDVLKGKEVEKTYIQPSWDIDKTIDTAIPVISVFAILLGLFSFIKKESNRVAGGAAALGVSAIAFQFVAMYAMALLAVLLIVAVLGAIGGG
ncbi:Inner membrane protein YidI [Nymphon striatum]|nr:Inner membrane protein YidI [Nymphon striatum]